MVVGIQHKKRATTIAHQTPRLLQLPWSVSRSSPRSHELTLASELLYAMITELRHVDMIIREQDSVRIA